MTPLRLSLLLLLGISAHAFVLTSHFSSMWDSTSYRFFPIAIALAVFVAYRRYPMLKSDGVTSLVTPNQSLILFGYLVSVCSAIATAILETPTLGWISFILFLNVLIYAEFGRRGLKAFYPSILILLLFRFLTASTDRYLALSLQQIVSLLASSLLDIAGQVHSREGNLLGLGSPIFHAEDACNGIRSLFSTLALVIAWNTLRSYGWGRSLFNFSQAFVWVIVFNAVRVATVLWFQAKSFSPIDTGLPQEIVVTLTLLVIVLFVLSTDQLVYAFTSKEEFSETESELPRSSNVLSVESISVNEPSASAQLSPESKTKNRLSVAWLAGLGIAALISLRMLTATSYLVPSQSLANEPQKQFLADQPEGWNLTNFAHEQHFDRHPLSKDTYQWTFRKGLREASIQLYEQSKYSEKPRLHFSCLGWKCGTLSATEKTDSSQSYEKFDIEKPSGESGVVFYTSVDRFGNQIQDKTENEWSPLFWVRRVAIGFRKLLGQTKSESGINFKPIALQLICRPSVTLQAKDFQELENLFSSVQTSLRLSPLFTREN